MFEIDSLRDAKENKNALDSNAIRHYVLALSEADKWWSIVYSERNQNGVAAVKISQLRMSELK